MPSGTSSAPPSPNYFSARRGAAPQWQQQLRAGAASRLEQREGTSSRSALAQDCSETQIRRPPAGPRQHGDCTGPAQCRWCANCLINWLAPCCHPTLLGTTGRLRRGVVGVPWPLCAQLCLSTCCTLPCDLSPRRDGGSPRMSSAGADYWKGRRCVKSSRMLRTVQPLSFAASRIASS